MSDIEQTRQPDIRTSEAHYAPNHKQVRVKANGQAAYVDEGIAPLIKEIWRAGIQTIMSCQKGAYGFVWLNFVDTEDAGEFLNIVAEYSRDSDSLYKRMFGRDAENPKSWIYKFHAEDYNLVQYLNEEADAFDEYHEGQPCFFFTVSIWFPPSDLPAVMERFATRRKAAEMK
jgi:hypothetical protein